MTRTDLDALGLIAARTATRVHFGTSDVSAGVLAGTRLNSAMNQQPTADLYLDLRRSATIPDYFGGVSVAVDHAGTTNQRFAGTVVEAQPGGGGEVAVSAKGAVAMSEGLLGGFVVRGVPTNEMVYTVARTAGMREEQLRIDGLDTLACETFEVVVPIDGLEVHEAVDFAGVRFTSPEAASRILVGLNPPVEMGTRFGAPTYALALVTARRVIDAEQEGLGRVDLALAWLTARMRYGLAVLPDGSPLGFNRRQALTRVTRRDIVAVRGLSTTRQWLRIPGVLPEAAAIDLEPNGARHIAQIPRLGQPDRYALLALTRAARETDPIVRLLAIWEAIEFYANGITVPGLFTDEERKRAAADAVASFSGLQRKRIQDALSGLNHPALGTKLKVALTEDGVPLSRGEMELLWKLRDLRNAIVHGQGITIPETEDLDYATSMVARMLVYRVHRLSGK